jgi:Adenylosuccinate lyase
VLGIIAGSVERVATEIRNLQKTELQEVEEFFHKKQKGSSAMPHKRNPILSENLSGLARMVRSYVIPALENIALWHERDISHSSVERNIGPDSTITLDFALFRLKNILNNMNVYPKKMLQNLNITKGLIFSQRVMIELTKYGFSREKAYALVQKNAQKSWSKNISFYESLAKDSLINKKISNKDLLKMFDINYHTKRIDLIFKRVFK